MSGARLRPPRRAAQAGFSLVELLMGIVVAMVFSVGLYAFFFSGTDAARSNESMGRAQASLRTSVEMLSRDLRQSVSADGGLNGPVTSLSDTTLIVHVDPSRSRAATDPRPQRVRYTVSGTNLTREVAQPVGASPPYTYGSYGPANVIAENVTQGGVPLFRAYTQQGDLLGNPVAQPRDIALVTIDLIVGQKTGMKSTTAELRTDVTLRNTIRF